MERSQETSKSTENIVTKEDGLPSPITKRPTKETWLKARIDYETGNYEGMRELASKYGLDYSYLRLKASREKWKQFNTVVANKISRKITEKVESKVDSLLSHLDKKGIYYEKLVEASQSQASRNSEGIPELEPVDLEKYARVEGIAIEWRKTALGIDNKSQVDVTSGGKSLEENIINIFKKVKELKAAGNSGPVVDVEYLKLCSTSLTD